MDTYTKTFDLLKEKSGRDENCVAVQILCLFTKFRIKFRV